MKPKKRGIANKPLVKRCSKLITPHNRNCGAVAMVKKGTWDTAWNGIVREHYFGNEYGNKTKEADNNIIWSVIGCNDTDCPAKKAIHQSVLNFA